MGVVRIRRAFAGNALGMIECVIESNDVAPHWSVFGNAGPLAGKS
ncbi:hypothetical protein YW7DRAFT_01580 [Streptomyces sp. AmelKG-E11A]|nr:hypothetical protein YW7DRAFT_01580 [Streptomyces sp. AmelKG-E11A]